MTVELSISIVNHQHGAMLSDLLVDLARVNDVAFEVLLTHNVADPSFELPASLPYPVRTLSNSAPRGFGANHNQALRFAAGQCFLVLNPDIRMPRFRFRPLLDCLQASSAGVCAPPVMEGDGSPANHARPFPTVGSLLGKLMLRRREPALPAYDFPVQVDWIAGMFMLFRREAFESVGGFDAQRYFLYYEDVDICRRLLAAGWTTLRCPGDPAIHHAQRASHRKLRYLWWHASSALRYFWRDIVG